MRALMSLVKAGYYHLFLFWYRFDLFTKNAENRLWKGVGAVTIVEVWLVGGVYACAGIVAQAALPVPPLLFALFVWILADVNHRILRRGGWRDLERRLDEYPPRKRAARLAVGAGITAVAFGFVLIAGMVLRASR